MVIYNMKQKSAQKLMLVSTLTFIHSGHEKWGHSKQSMAPEMKVVDQGSSFFFYKIYYHL